MAAHRPVRAPLLLVGLLLLLLSGLPQLGISFTELDTDGKSFRRVTLSRSLLMDKLLPEASTLSPPAASRYPALVDQPPAPSFSFVFLRQVAAHSFEPAPWLRDLTVRLYQHHSSYV